jgi:hypothetical protein
MARSKMMPTKLPGKAVDRARSLPWAALLQAGAVVHGRWRRLSDKDRARAMQLLRKSQGRITKLGSKEREELRRLVRKADLKGMGRELIALRRGRWRRRRHR